MSGAVLGETTTEELNLHGDVVEALGGVVGCSEGAARGGEGGRCRVQRVLVVGETAPVAAVDDEDGEGEGVAENELGDSGDVHGDGAEEVVVAVKATYRGDWRGSLKATQAEDGRGVWDQEAEEAEEGWVGCGMSVGTLCRDGARLHQDLPNVFDKPPLAGPVGWKKRRSYCSGLMLTVTWRPRAAPFPLPLSSTISCSILWSIAADMSWSGSRDYDS